MSHDPLAGLLPAGNPLAPFDAAAAIPDSAPARTTPPDLDILPALEADSELEILPDQDVVPELEIAQDSEDPPVPVISPIPPFSHRRSGSRGDSSRGDHSVVGRRRRSRNAPLIAGMGLVVCVAIGVCVYLLASGFGISQHGKLVAVRSEQNEVPANAAPEANAVPEGAEANGANRAAPVEPPRRDPVMGGLLASPPNAEPQPAPAPATPAPTAERPAGAEMQEPAPTEPTAPPDAAPPAAAPTENAPPETPSMEADPAPDAPMPDAPMPDAPMPDAPMPDAPMPDEDGAVSPLSPAIETLRSGQYSEMLAAAEQAQRAATTPQQRKLAAGMHLLAELADYYVEGIRRGAAGLGAAETFEIVPGTPVIVVESSRDQVVLKVNGRVKSYPFESMPLVLAHRLTAFSLPADDPVATAAAGAYQSLWPQATDAHRRQAFEWWRNLEGDAGDVDYSQLEPTVREIFEMPHS